MGFLRKLGKAAKSLTGRRMRGRVAKVATGGLGSKSVRNTLMNISPGAPGAGYMARKGKKLGRRGAGWAAGKISGF